MEAVKQSLTETRAYWQAEIRAVSGKKIVGLIPLQFPL